MAGNKFVCFSKGEKGAWARVAIRGETIIANCRNARPCIHVKPKMVPKRRGCQRGKTCFAQSDYLSTSRGKALLRARHKAVLDSLCHETLRSVGHAHFLYDYKVENGSRSRDAAQRQSLLNLCRMTKSPGTARLREQVSTILQDWSWRAITADREKVQIVERLWKARRKAMQNEREEEERQRRPGVQNLIEGKRGEIKWTVWV